MVVANGHYNTPRTPTIPHLHHFNGVVSHSSSYRTPACFAGKRVTVIGDGPSALDMAEEIASVARSVCVSTRSSADAGSGGDAHTRPDLQFPVTWVPEIVDCTDAGHLVLANGGTCRRCQVMVGATQHHVRACACIMTATLPDQDAILFCTGYRYEFPFLDDAVVSTKDNVVAPLYVRCCARGHYRAGGVCLRACACRFQHLFHVTMPTLGMLSIPLRVDPWPLADVQSRALARVWSGECELPAESTRAEHQAQLLKAAREAGQPLHHSHLLSTKQYVFNAWLLPLPPLTQCAGVCRWAYHEALTELMHGPSWRETLPGDALRIDTLRVSVSTGDALLTAGSGHLMTGVCDAPGDVRGRRRKPETRVLAIPQPRVLRASTRAAPRNRGHVLDGAGGKHSSANQVAGHLPRVWQQRRWGSRVGGRRC